MTMPSQSSIGEITVDVRDLATDERVRVRELISSRELSLQVKEANLEDFPIISGMVDDAKVWLRTKETDQWSTDWLDKDGRNRNDRMKCSIKEGKTRLASVSYHGARIPVATATIEESEKRDIWEDNPYAADGRALYLSRLVTARGLSGLRIGSAMIDWACKYAARVCGADWIRIDVWTDNSALHKYYMNEGFLSCGDCPDVTYPSRALFERSTSKVMGIGPEVAS
jgi:GNAT superfamily N-acetyltransferase